MVDADHFKSINDQFGHLVGDSALRNLARAVTCCARDSDMVFRYGGEEFVVVLSNTRLGGAGNLADRIRRAVKRTGLEVEELTLPLTVSIGAAELLPGESGLELLTRADLALYEAKRKGRDRVETAGQAGDAPAARTASDAS